MNFLNKLEKKYRKYAIPNLMYYIVMLYGAGLVIQLFNPLVYWQFLSLDVGALMHGQIWRLVTFIFMPGYYSTGDVLWLALFLYFYYMIGSTLEREWGTAKFSLYYLSGVVLTLIVGIVMGLVTGQDVWITGTNYVNLSMFFAFAMLYPDTQFLVFFIIPVKVKWLAWIDAAFFALSVLSSLFAWDLLGALLPIIALLNFFVFFWTNIADEIAYRRGRARQQHSHQTIHFKSAVRQQEKKAREQGYRHKCEVCGRTDTEFPDLQFRYCSRCTGYHCFCEDHIFSHVHFTE